MAFSYYSQTVDFLVEASPRMGEMLLPSVHTYNIEGVTLCSNHQSIFPYICFFFYLLCLQSRLFHTLYWQVKDLSSIDYLTEDELLSPNKPSLKRDFYDYTAIFFVNLFYIEVNIVAAIN